MLVDVVDGEFSGGDLARDLLGGFDDVLPAAVREGDDETHLVVVFRRCHRTIDGVA